MPDKRKALGRGLSALLPEIQKSPSNSESTGDVSGVQEIDLDLLEPNPDQPRSVLDDSKLDELAQSIRSHGVIQPIVVTPNPHRQGGFYIVAGERRWRASQRAGLLRAPVVVREIEHTKRLEMALIENIQRENLNPIEEASAYKRLSDDFQLTQAQIAESVGKDRATVANYQRLLGLPQEVRADVAAGFLSMGHARALVALPDARAQRHIAREIRSQDLSVRETEALVKRITTPKRSPSTTTNDNDVHTKAAEERLRLSLGTRVRIARSGQGGRIEVSFKSENELQRLYERLTRRE